MNVNDLLELVKVVSAWRRADCSFLLHSPDKAEEGRQCEGENHLFECAVNKALDDVYAVHDKLDPQVGL